jgi:hypothetical protein
VALAAGPNSAMIGGSRLITTSMLVRGSLVALGLLLAGVATSSFVAGDASLLLPAAIGLAAVALSTAALLWPEAMILVLLFLLFTRLSDLYRPAGWPLSLNQLAVALLLVSVLLHRVVMHHKGLVKDRTLAGILVYAVAMALSSLAAVDRATAISALLIFLREVLIVFVLVNLVRTVRGLRLVTWTLLAGGAVLAAAAVLDLATGYELGGLSSRGKVELLGDALGTRLAGTIGNSNDFAGMLVLAVSLALYRAWGERRLILRLVGLVTALLSSAVSAWTFSRSGFLALLVVLGIAATMQRKTVHLLVVGLVLGAFAVAAPRSYWSRIEAVAQYAGAATPRFPLGAAPSPLGSRATPNLPPGNATSSPAASGDSTKPSPGHDPVKPPPGTATSNAAPSDELQERAGLWWVGVQMFLDHPLTGVGKGNYDFLYQHYAVRSAYLPATPMAPHSSPVQIAAETGLIGLVAYASVVSVALIGLRQAKRGLVSAGRGREVMLLEAIEIAIYGYLVTSLFQDDDVLYRRYLWLLIGLAIVGRQVTLRAVPSAQQGMPDRAVVREST